MKKVMMIVVVMLMTLMSCGDSKVDVVSDEVKVEEMSKDTIENVVVDDWDLTITTDEFGDPTGDSVYVKLFNGVFTNSAVNNKELTIRIVDYGNSYIMGLYEYNKRLANISYENSDGSINVKFSNGDTKKFKTIYIEGSGLYFDEDSEFYTLLKTNKDTEFKISIDSDAFSNHGGRSTYKFKIKSRI